MKAILLVLILAAFAQFAFGQLQDTAPIPEPSTIAMLSIGLAGFGLAAWRRSRKK